MWFSSLIIALSSIAGYVSASPLVTTGCVATSYYFGYSVTPGTTETDYEDAIIYFTTETVFVPTTTITTYVTTTDSSISTATSYIPASTVIVTSTKTVGATKTSTKTCPQCLSPTSTTTFSYIADVSPTVYITRTYSETATHYLSSTTSIAKVTTGSPPTTKRVTHTTTQKTVYKTVTNGDLLFFTVTTTKTTSSGIFTKTSAVLKTVSPTAKATITLFSLQLKGDYYDNYLHNGNTFHIDSDKIYGHVLAPQNSSVVQWYIEPVTGRLIELKSGWHVEETTSETGEPFIGIAATPDHRPYQQGDFYVGSLVNCSAVCGQPLYCTVDNLELEDTLTTAFDLAQSGGGKYYAEPGFDAPYSNIGNGALFVVAPTKGT